MSKYEFRGTPGEWFSDGNVVFSESDGFVCVCTGGPHTEHYDAKAISAVPKLIEALRPFAAFIDAFDAKPLSGMSDEFYTIHAGTEHEATISRKHMRDARSALAKATFERTGGGEDE